jgi:hypothetical protein
MKTKDPQLTEVNCPGIEKDNHNIKGNENEGIKVIAEVKLNP